MKKNQLNELCGLHLSVFLGYLFLTQANSCTTSSKAPRCLVDKGQNTRGGHREEYSLQQTGAWGPAIGSSPQPQLCRTVGLPLGLWPTEARSSNWEVLKSELYAHIHFPISKTLPAVYKVCLLWSYHCPRSPKVAAAKGRTGVLEMLTGRPQKPNGSPE